MPTQLNQNTTNLQSILDAVNALPEAGGSGNILTVNAPTGSTVTATKDGETKTATENSGVWVFKGLEAGTWTITASLGSYSQTYTREFVDEMTIDVTYASSTLDDNSWSVIGEISDAWQIGGNATASGDVPSLEGQ